MLFSCACRFDSATARADGNCALTAWPARRSEAGQVEKPANLFCGRPLEVSDISRCSDTSSTFRTRLQVFSSALQRAVRGVRGIV